MQTQSILRLAALGGTVAALLWDSSGVSPGGSFWGSLAVTIVYGAAVFATVFLLAPDGWRRLHRHPNVLVPVGLMVGLLTLLYVPLAQTLGLAAPWFTVRLGFGAQAVSLGFLLTLLVHAFGAVWLTVLVLDAVRRDQSDLLDSFQRSWRVFPRVLLLLTIMWTLSWLLLVAELALLLGASWAIGWGLVQAGLGIVGWAIIWALSIGVLGLQFLINMATAALLPVFVESQRGFWSAIRSGISESWRHRRKWLLLLLTQFLLVGAWASVEFSYSNSRGPGHQNSNFKFNTNFNAPWIGDYDYDATCYGRGMGWLHREELAMARTLNALLCILLAVVVKLAIVERLPPSSDSETAVPCDSLSEEP